MKFPAWWEAPDEILQIDGHCGLVAAWAVLRYFGKRVSVPKLIHVCRYTQRHGVFTVTLAAGLKAHGLSVAFHSDRDTDIGGFEKRCYGYANRLGVSPQPSVDVSYLLRERRRGRIPIVLFNTPEDNGHFSPLLGRRARMLQLPLAEKGEMSEAEFLIRWSEVGILKQCVIVGG
jgi:hypothetical protein